MYVLIDVKNGDEFVNEYDSLDAAIHEASYEWSLLTYREKIKRDEFFIAERCSDDPEDDDYFNYNVIKDFKKDWHKSNIRYRYYYYNTVRYILTSNKKGSFVSRKLRYDKMGMFFILDKEKVYVKEDQLYR